MRYRFICLYCGHNFPTSDILWQDMENPKCPKCRDSNLKKISYETKDVFGYYWNLKPKEES